MAAANSIPETDNQRGWFNRLFSVNRSTSEESASSTNRLTSFVNPTFESFGDILRFRRLAEQHPRPSATNIEESLVDIAVSGETDVSYLADKSRGKTDFLHSSTVSLNIY